MNQSICASKKMFFGFVIAAMFVGVMALSTSAHAQTSVVNANEFTYSGVMKVGMSGPGISTLQAALNTVNTGVSTIIVDGKFGPATMGAVQRFQSSHGLVADGVVGPITGNALKNATASLIVVPSGPLCPNGMTYASSCTLPPSPSPAGPLCPNGKTLASNCTSSGAGEALCPNGMTLASNCDAHTNSGSSSSSSSSSTVTGSGPHSNSTTASLISVDGADNDLGVYTIKVDINAFGHDMFISQNGGTAYSVAIQDASTGATLSVGDGTRSTTVSSSASTEGGSYRIDEDTSETFTFTITVNPDSADEGKSIRVQLLSIASGSTDGTPTGNTFTISVDNQSKYRTAGVVIPD